MVGSGQDQDHAACSSVCGSDWEAPSEVWWDAWFLILIIGVVQFDKQDTSLMSDFEQRRLKAKERSKLAKQGGNGMAQLLKFKHQLSRGKAGVALNTATKSTKLKPQHKVNSY